jgi:hypothetical protein
MENKNKGLNFLAGVGLIYVFAVLFAYSFITISSSLVTGNAAIDIADNDSSALQQMHEKEVLYQTIYVIGIIFLTVLFIWIVVYVFSKKSRKNSHVKIRRYRAVKTR